jgi:hypothetical protein
LDSLVVTHPYHPLAGRRVHIVRERRSKSPGRIYICEAGQLGNLALSESFTDRGPASDPHPLNVEVLAELATTMSAIRSLLTRRASL